MHSPPPSPNPLFGAKKIGKISEADLETQKAAEERVLQDANQTMKLSSAKKPAVPVQQALEKWDIPGITIGIPTMIVVVASMFVLDIRSVPNALLLVIAALFVFPTSLSVTTAILDRRTAGVTRGIERIFTIKVVRASWCLMAALFFAATMIPALTAVSKSNQKGHQETVAAFQKEIDKKASVLEAKCSQNQAKAYKTETAKILKGELLGTVAKTETTQKLSDAYVTAGLGC